MYGCESAKIFASMPGLLSSPGCGSLPPMGALGTAVGGSSVDRRSHLQFHRSPGRWWFQKSWAMGSTVFQNCWWSFPGLGDVDGIHLRLGSTSASRMNCCQFAACRARRTAVSYSVRSQRSHWCDVMEWTSFFHCSNVFRLPFESVSWRATSFWSRCVLNAAKTALLWRSACRKSSSGCGAWPSPMSVARLKVRQNSWKRFRSMSVIGWKFRS